MRPWESSSTVNVARVASRVDLRARDRACAERQVPDDVTAVQCQPTRPAGETLRCRTALSLLASLSATENPVPDSLAASLRSQHRYHRPSRVSSKLHWFLRRVYFKDFLDPTTLRYPPLPLEVKKVKAAHTRLPRVVFRS